MFSNEIMNINTLEKYKLRIEADVTPALKFSNNSIVNSGNWALVSGSESQVINPIFVVDVTDGTGRMLTHCPTMSLSCHGWISNT